LRKINRQITYKLSVNGIESILFKLPKFISYLLAHWVYLHLGQIDNLDGFDSAQQALILLLPDILLLSLLTQLEIVRPWLNDRGFDFCLMRCKI
jgi:hypothetical protein